jgi:hypothetical protein
MEATDLADSVRRSFRALLNVRGQLNESEYESLIADGHNMRDFNG